MTYTLSLLMGLILGFAAHRAGLCTVKAVAEVLTTRRTHFLWSFAKSALWVMVVAMLAGIFASEPGFRHWPLTASSVFGGVVFGIGAGFNGGCTFSTLSRLMDGNVGILATVCGWPIGIELGLWFWSIFATPPVAVPAHLNIVSLVPIKLFLMVWALWEAIRLIRRMWRAGSLARVFGAHVYTLSAAAALVGLSNAVLLEVSGPWSFTGTLLCALDAGTLANCADPMLPWLIFGAALVGMLGSAVQRGSFQLHLPTRLAVIRHGAGGVLMGLGSVLIPAGNDGLILFAIPTLSPHAFAAYAGILLGILLALLTIRAMGHQITRIECQGDICRAQL